MRRLPWRPSRQREAVGELLAGPHPVAWTKGWVGRDFRPFAVCVGIVAAKYVTLGGHFLVAAVAALVGLALLYGISIRPKLIMTDEVLIAINPIGAWACPLEEIESIDSALHGLRITTWDGTRLAAWAA